MAKIHSFNFGFIVVDGKQYVNDVLILPDGTVREREAVDYLRKLKAPQGIKIHDVYVTLGHYWCNHFPSP